MTKGIQIETMPDLTKRILSQWKLKQEEALAQQKEQEKKLRAAVQEEKKLTEKLKMARTIAGKMEKEYSGLECKIETEKRERIAKESIREEDVLEGRASLREFTQKGMTEKQISEKAVKQTIGELEQGLKAARSKRLEILELEKSLLECQTRIRYLIISPGQILQKVLKDLSEFTDREIGLFLEDVNSARTALDQVKNKLLLTQGKSLGPGYNWPNLTLEEAHKIMFDPIMAQECVPKLKAELEKFKDAETVNINYYLRNKDIQVTSFTFGRKE